MKNSSFSLAFSSSSMNWFCVLLLSLVPSQRMGLAQAQSSPEGFNTFDLFAKLIQGTAGFQLPKNKACTLFAPDDAVIGHATISESSDNVPWWIDPYGWEGHLVYLLGHHVVPEKLDYATFEFEPTFKTTLANTTLMMLGDIVGPQTGAATITKKNALDTGGLHTYSIISNILVPPSMQKNIYQTLLDDESKKYSTIIDLIDSANMKSVFETTSVTISDPMTFLAPTNDAFLETGGQDFLTLLQQHPTFRIAFLMHHMISGNIYEWNDGDILESVLPSTLFVYQDDKDSVTSTLAVNDAIIDASNERILCQNGVLVPLHTAPLIPPSISSMLRSIHLLSNGRLELRLFANALSDVGFLNDLDLTDETFDGPKQLTILAPDNQAMENMPAGLEKYFGNSWRPHLKSLLRHHIIGSADHKMRMRELGEMQSIETLSGFKVNVTTIANNETIIEDDEYTIDGKSHVAFSDVLVYNSTIQIIDNVLVPPTLKTSIWKQVKNVPEFSMLAELLERVLLDETLDTGDGPYTLFALTNDVLTQQNLDLTDMLQVRHIMQYHVVKGVNFVTKLAEEGDLPTMLPGMTLQITKSERDLMVNGIPLNQQKDNNLASNGVIHVMSTALSLPDGFTMPPTTPPTLAPGTSNSSEELMGPASVATASAEKTTNSGSASIVVANSMCKTMLLLVSTTLTMCVW